MYRKVHSDLNAVKKEICISKRQRERGGEREKQTGKDLREKGTTK